MSYSRQDAMLLLPLLLIGFADASVAGAQCAPLCYKTSPLHSICENGFRNRMDIPLPLDSSFQTLYFDNVPIPPPAIKGIITAHPVYGLSYGFQFNGAFYSSGIGTGSDSSHSAVFWHDRADYLGYEYGFVSDLRNGLVLFYLCADCNTVNQRWGQTLVHGNYLNGVPVTYDVQVTVAGDFQVTARRLSNGGLVTSMTVVRPAWLPNLYGVGGYVTGVFQARVNKPAFYNSYLDLQGLWVYSDQCQ